VNYALEQNNAISVVQIEDVKKDLYESKNAIGATLEDKVKFLSIAKSSLTLDVSGKVGEPLTVTAITTNNKGETNTHVVASSSLLAAADELAMTQHTIEKRLRGFNNAEFTLDRFDFEHYQDNLTVPFKELTNIKNELAFLLNGSVNVVKHVEVPKLPVHAKVEEKPKLSIMIADLKDLHLCDETEADVYFKLPESFKKNCTKYIDLLLANPRLIPWFPAVLIGKDYLEAVKILEQVKPARIVTNNTGVAYKAFELNIDWIAGPFLNTTNSHALLTMQEELNCSGAFISNEINRGQIKHIRRPENFKLLYSIYHPILMMTSRQCFFQQTVGCKKPSIEDGCMLKCEKATTITNVKGISFAVDKQKGGYPSIYNDEQFLNFDAVDDFSGLFDEFFIDLTNIGAGSKEEQDKSLLVKHFEALLSGVEESKTELNQLVTISTNAQYRQGL
jgi:putative protease